MLQFLSFISSPILGTKEYEKQTAYVLKDNY